jgi:hypothetical protein
MGQAAAPAAGRERPPRGGVRDRVAHSGRGSFTPLPLLCVLKVRPEVGGTERRLRFRGHVRNPLRHGALQADAAAVPAREP